jgi:hypothetical protein
MADPAMAREAPDQQRRWMLATIRGCHSAVFLVMLSAIAWLVATGLTGRRDRSVAIAGGLVAIQSVVFIGNHGVCPLTPLAERYGARRGSVSDIFLPDVIARTIPIWATSLVVLGIMLHARGLVRTGPRRVRRAGGGPAPALRARPRPVVAAPIPWLPLPAVPG